MDIQKLIDEYTAWLKKEITFHKIGEYYEITTPYLDNANDYLQIYVKQYGNEIFITDDGTIIQGLKMSGLTLTSSRTEHIQKILLQYGIKLKGNELTAQVPLCHFAQKKHLFIQAMLRIDDMFYMNKSKVTSFFLDDVQEFFDQKDIYCTNDVQFTGISGFSHNYDFLIQRSKTKPERLCQTVNNPNKSGMSNILFSWNDTKPARKNDSQLIVILNDEKNINKGIKDAFDNYGVKVIYWSQRENKYNLDLLAAV